MKETIVGRLSGNRVGKLDVSSLLAHHYVQGTRLRVTVEPIPGPDHEIVDSISTILASIFMGSDDWDENEVMSLASRISETITIDLMRLGGPWDDESYWEQAAEHFKEMACEALDGRH